MANDKILNGRGKGVSAELLGMYVSAQKAREGNPNFGQPSANGKGIDGVGHIGYLEMGDDNLNKMQVEVQKTAEANIAREMLSVQIANFHSGFKLKNGEVPILLNQVNDSAAYAKAEKMLAEATNGGSISKETLAGSSQDEYSANIGRAYLDMASYKIARGEMSSRDASAGYQQMQQHFGFSMPDSIRTHVVLFPEHYQALDPKTRDQMDPMVRERAMQDLARLEVVGGFSLADAQGKLKTTHEATDTKFPEGHESIITPAMAAENKRNQDALKSAVESKVAEDAKKAEEQENAPQKGDASSLATGQSGGGVTSATKEAAAPLVAGNITAQTPTSPPTAPSASTLTPSAGVAASV